MKKIKAEEVSTDEGLTREEAFKRFLLSTAASRKKRAKQAAKAAKRGMD